MQEPGASSWRFPAERSMDTHPRVQQRRAPAACLSARRDHEFVTPRALRHEADRDLGGHRPVPRRPDFRPGCRSIHGRRDAGRRSRRPLATLTRRAPRSRRLRHAEAPSPAPASPEALRGVQLDPYRPRPPDTASSKPMQAIDGRRTRPDRKPQIRRRKSSHCGTPVWRNEKFAPV